MAHPIAGKAPLRWALCLCFFLASTPLRAADIDTASFNQPSPQEQAQLRSILEQPVPVNVAQPVVFAHFVAKEAAATRLGDLSLKLRVYKQWQEAAPQSLSVGNYAMALSQSGKPEQGLRLLEDTLTKRSLSASREQLRWAYANFLSQQGQADKAQEARTQVRDNLHALRLQTQNNDNLRRIAFLESTALCYESGEQLNHGKPLEAIAPANAALTAAREGLQISKDLPRNDKNRTDLLIDAGNYLSALQCRERAYQTAGDYGEAEAMLGEMITVAQDYALNPIHLVTTYQTAGNLRLDLREFSVAETHFLAADARAEAMGFANTHNNRLDLARQRISALEGQKKWAAALAEFARLDALAAGNPKLQRQVRFPLIRGYAYLGSQVEPAQAEREFAALEADVTRNYPAQHFYVAQAQGLRGVALWRQGTTGPQSRALPLLQSAVKAYMQADNLVYETKGISQDIRDVIFASYLEAMFASPSGHAMESMVPADWVRGGAVQEALADAAVRSTASVPALAQLVRADQDARNEIENLRKRLVNDAESSTPPAPQASATLRSRIEALEASRKALHATIREKAPDYDNLVRPVAPSVQGLSAALKKDEVLVMLLPTEAATYVWAVRSDGNNLSARVDIRQAQLEKQVRALRQTLDFAEMGGHMAAFDAEDAHALYRQLLAPVAAALQGKKHLIVAAGGVLGQIPFGILLTQPGKATSADAPWLIKQLAITHVPGLSAWLAVKQLAQAPSAPEALIAWGDPSFRPSTRQYTSIPALPETRDELLSMAAALKANPQKDLHLGTLATKASVLQSSSDGELPRKKVVAFATHGLVAGDLPHLTQPALALASTDNEAQDPLGALLTLDEVLNLKLNADWVILSACNTAAADGRADEALSGLARGFFYAGSRSLLVTHWSVESESAKQLTTQTMTHYTTHPTARKAESLQQAMLAVMRDTRYTHPAFWGPYALVGDGGR